jgi:hypothetical protein
MLTQRPSIRELKEPRERVRFLSDEERSRLLDACKAICNRDLYLALGAGGGLPAPWAPCSPGRPRGHRGDCPCAVAAREAGQQGCAPHRQPDVGQGGTRSPTVAPGAMPQRLVRGRGAVLTALPRAPGAIEGGQGRREATPRRGRDRHTPGVGRPPVVREGHAGPPEPSLVEWGGGDAGARRWEVGVGWQPLGTRDSA